MIKKMSGFVLVLAIVLFVGGCSWRKHKSYTFDEKFEYHSNKVMKHIKKVVSDKGKLEKIKKKILSHKADLKVFSESTKKGKSELIDLLLKSKDKDKVKNRLKTLADKKIEKFSLLVDLIFEIRDELSEEEWNQLSEEFNKKCSHWWK